MKATSLKDLTAININDGDKYTFIDKYLYIKTYINATKSLDDSVKAILSDYWNNRAGVPLNMSHVTKISENLRTPDISLIPIALDPETLQWHIFDGHNRTEALHKRFNEGKMKEEEANSLILLRIVPWEYAIETYVNINNTEKHTNNNKLFNPDMPANKFLEGVLKKANISSISSPWKRAVFNQCFAVAREDYKADYKKVSKYYASKANPHLNTTPSQGKKSVVPEWSSQKEEMLVYAIKKTTVLFNAVGEKAGNSATKQLKKLLKSVTFFGNVLALAINPDYSNMFKKTDICADNIIAEAATLWTIVSNFSAETDIKLSKFVELLKNNTEKKKNKDKTVSFGFKMSDSFSKDGEAGMPE